MDAPRMFFRDQLPALVVSVVGIGFHYQLTQEDLTKVFSRYGVVKSVCVEGNGNSAVVEFHSLQAAKVALCDLDGKHLNGVQGELRVTWAPAPNPHPLAFPVSPARHLDAPSPHRPAFPPSPPSSPNAHSAGNYAGARQHCDGRLIRKYTARFDIGIDNDKEFQVARRIIGTKGANMKMIYRQSGAKLRLRGKGSGFLEGTAKQESPEPLHLCISCREYNGYVVACSMSRELLGRIYRDFSAFCAELGRECGEISVAMKEHLLVSRPRTKGRGNTQPMGRVAPCDEPIGKCSSRTVPNSLNGHYSSPTLYQDDVLPSPSEPEPVHSLSGKWLSSVSPCPSSTCPSPSYPASLCSP